MPGDTEDKLIAIINEIITKQTLQVKINNNWHVVEKFTGRSLDGSQEILCKNGDGWPVASSVKKIESLRLP